MDKVPFDVFSFAISKNIIDKVKSGAVFATVALSKDEAWDTYLESFPEKYNPIFRTNRTYDCTEDKNFIRVYGNVVTIEPDGQCKSIWDIEVGGYYQIVADALKKAAESRRLVSVFTYNEQSAGRVNNVDTHNTSIVWKHFYLQTPTAFNDRTGKKARDIKEGADMFERACKLFTSDAIDDLLALINSGSVYRGASFRDSIQRLKQLVDRYRETPVANKRGIAILSAKAYPAVVRLRNTAIGTLLEDMSLNSASLDDMLESYGRKVDPVNYRRPTATASVMSIKKAKEKLDELGLMNSLSRRFATEADISANNVLFTSYIKPNIDVFDDMLSEASSKPKNLELKSVIQIDYDKFIRDVLPTVDSFEVLMEPRLRNNLVALTTEQIPGSGNLFNWDNPFAWAYKGNVADSITERVKAAGGGVEGPLRISLSWHNSDDLDLQVTTPHHTIYFASRTCRRTGGTLDVDMNHLVHDSVHPVENVVFPSKLQLANGVYKVVVNNFAKRSNNNPGFTVQVAFNGETHNYSFPSSSVRREEILSVKVNNGNFEIVDVQQGVTLDSSVSDSTETWGIKANTFVPVTSVMYSPNCWDEDKGHKHTFFMLKDCRPDEALRGVFNEYLHPELNEYRRVFETLGDLTKVQPADDALAGIGFSSKKDKLTVRTTGRMRRTYEITF